MPYLLLLLAVSFWSGNFIVARGIQHNIPPISLSFWRWFVAFLILFPFSARSFIRQRELILRHGKLIVLLGILGVSIFSTFIYLALQSSTVTNTVLINAFNPIFIVIISWVGFKDRVSWIQVLGIVISLSGLIWIITRGTPTILLSLQFARGDLWTLAAAFCWALYTVLLRKYPAGLDPMSFLTAIIVIGLVCLLPPYLWEASTHKPVTLSAGTICGTIYLGLFASLLAYICWNNAVKTVGANKAGVFIYLIPVFSIILAFLIFGERFQAYHPPGMVLIFLGIFFATYRR